MDELGEIIEITEVEVADNGDGVYVLSPDVANLLAWYGAVRAGELNSMTVYSDGKGTVYGPGIMNLVDLDKDMVPE